MNHFDAKSTMKCNYFFPPDARRSRSVKYLNIPLLTTYKDTCMTIHFMDSNTQIGCNCFIRIIKITCRFVKIYVNILWDLAYKIINQAVEWFVCKNTKYVQERNCSCSMVKSPLQFQFDRVLPKDAQCQIFEHYIWTVDLKAYSQAIPWIKTCIANYSSHTYIRKADYSTLLGALIKWTDEI